MEIKTKEELINYLENYEITYDYEEEYTEIKNACIEYMNNTQDFDIEDCFNDIVSYDLAEEQAKYEFENSDLYSDYYIIDNDKTKVYEDISYTKKFE